MKRCAIYTRTATTDDQTNLLQRLSCEKYILGKGSEGWALSSQIYEDNGVFGDTIIRPALQRLMEDIADGEIDIVIVQGMDRLSRSVSVFCQIIDFLNFYDIPLITVKEGCGTDSNAGRLVMQLLAARAEYEDRTVRSAA